MNTKKVYLYKDNELIKIFETTQECADYLKKDREYLYHNLKYCKKIRFEEEWYKISRTEEVEVKTNETI